MKDLNFLQRLGLAFNKKSLEQLLQTHIKEFLSGEDFKHYLIDTGSRIPLTFSVVFACFRILSETFASVPVFEYKKLENGDREQTDDLGLMRILHDTPNEFMSAYNFAEAMMYQINLGGNAVAIRQNNALNGLGSLFPLTHERVQIKLKDKKIIYVVDNKEEFTRDKVFHIPGPSLNGIVGMSIIEMARNAIDLGQSYEQFANSFYNNGAMPSLIFEHDNPLKDDSYKRLKQQIKKEYTGLKKAGVPLLLEGGLHANALTMKFADAEFLSSKKFQVEEFCRFCRIPLHLVQSLDRSTNNNIEHQSLEFVMYTMLPHFKRAEQCINAQLLSYEQRKEGYYYEYNISTLVRGDLKSRYDAYGKARQWGYMSVNDIRRLENMPRIENGDLYLQPMNMVEAGAQQQQKENSIDGIIDSRVKDEIERILEEKYAI